MKKIVSLFICIALIFSLSAMPVSAESIEVDNHAAIMDFSVELLKNCMDSDGNVVISPLSVMYALALTMNGAEGDTLSQMENVLGMSREEVNAYLPGLMASLSDENSPLSSINSIWIKEEGKFVLNEEFIAANSELYGADIFAEPFDAETVEKINAWVAEGTDGMIPEMLNELAPEAVMYLINAVCFSSVWQDAYDEEDIKDGIFTTEEGTEQHVDMMHSTEGIYLEDEFTTGFMKPYEGNDYAFVALLPAEGMTIAEYIAYINGENVTEIIKTAQYTDVHTSIPQFSTDFSIEMDTALQNMGIINAFDPALADLSGIGAYDGANLAVGSVSHKVHITVNAEGTEAAAATNVGIMTMSARPPMDEPLKVDLDRPFVYMIIDCNTQLPVFMGVVESIN